MTFLKKLFDFYLNASIHVALAVFSFVKITELYYGLEHNGNLNYFIFFATITGYNFVKYFGIAKFHHRSLTNDLKIIQVFSFVCFLLMCFYGFQLSIKTVFILAGFGLLTILYAIPFLSGFQKNLRNISYLKIVVVALVWAGVTVLIPVFDSFDIVDYQKITFLFLQRFLLVCALILPFDIRDIKYDVISLQTIPRKIGIQNTKKLGFVLLLFALVIEFLISSDEISKNVFLAFSLIIMFFLMRAKENQSSYYSSFWVESLPIFWWIIVVFFI